MCIAAFWVGFAVGVVAAIVWASTQLVAELD
jgi:hypothetical protein